MCEHKLYKFTFLITKYFGNLNFKRLLRLSIIDIIQTYDL